MNDKLCNHTSTEGGKRMICTREAGHAGWHMGKPVAEMQPACVGDVPDLPDGMIDMSTHDGITPFNRMLETVVQGWFDNKPDGKRLVTFTYNGVRYVPEQPAAVSEDELRRWANICNIIEGTISNEESPYKIFKECHELAQRLRGLIEDKLRQF